MNFNFKNVMKEEMKLTFWNWVSSALSCEFTPLVFKSVTGNTVGGRGAAVTWFTGGLLGSIRIRTTLVGVPIRGPTEPLIDILSGRAGTAGADGAGGAGSAVVAGGRGCPAGRGWIGRKGGLIGAAEADVEGVGCSSWLSRLSSYDSEATGSTAGAEGKESGRCDSEEGAASSVFLDTDASIRARLTNTCSI